MMSKILQPKRKKLVQWGALLGAIAVGVQQLTAAGAIPVESAIWVLVITNVVSAVLPGILDKVK